MSHTHVTHSTHNLKYRLLRIFWTPCRKTGKPEIPEFPKVPKVPDPLRELYSIDHFLWQTTLPMTGQPRDPKRLNSAKQAPRTRIFRKTVFRKWEKSQIPDLPKSDILALLGKSQKSQKSDIFPCLVPVQSSRLPDPARSCLRSAHFPEKVGISQNIVSQIDFCHKY